MGRDSEVMRKVLLLGGSGYMGKAFNKELVKREYEIYSPSLSHLNYCDFNTLQQYVESLGGIDFLINAAGFTGKPNVEQCELRRDETIKGNLILPQMLSHLAGVNEFRWLQIGTGCIYEGDNNGKGYTEEDEPNFTFKYNNCSFYSGVKGLAEECLKNDNRCYIARLRIPFNNLNSPRNYISKLLTYPVTYNNINSLSHIGDYTRACLDLYEKKCPSGVYNVTNDKWVDTKQVVDLIKRIIKPKKHFKYFNNDKEFYKFATTPRSNCALNINKLKSFGISMRSVTDALEDSLLNWQN